MVVRNKGIISQNPLNSGLGILVICRDTSGWYPNHPFGDICSVSVALDRSWNKRKKSL